MKWVLAFIRDVELYQTVSNQLSGLNFELKFVSTADTAIRELQQSGVNSILVDVRDGSVDQETTSLVERLAGEEVESANIISLGNHCLPQNCAAELDLIAAKHVDICNGDIDNVLRDESVVSILTSPRASHLPEKLSITGGDITFSTLEEDFFHVLDDLKRIAHRNVTLLIIGETGTGKTTLARLIHERSPRRDRPFQHIACGALPPDIIESELFGHMRGSFTGADRNKIGRFQAAGQGTLLLDEIDVLDVKEQAKLLKVIETGEYEMVGSTESRQSEARLIVASNVNLESLAENARFRSDLYYRLSVLEFRLLPLRERVADIVPLAMQFVRECCVEHEIEIRLVERDFLDAIRTYRWPGNIRELKNHIRRAVLFAENGVLTVNDLSHKVIQAQFESTEDGTEAVLNGKRTLADQVARNERDLLVQALEANGDNRTKTAKALGISRVGLYKKLKKHGLTDRT